ncbi:hypothetical protein J2R99_000841 [Rhodopseudomonas julia]|uniref:Metallothionein n=1 Tax=Rhodopseudomonas julia TaxID=200617 RepID=A0ABU0C429_9BRAD|nr:hypothetical protein [Rhodopseudomonas julia]MDQ0324992.1 hypothetical protein [Rhodopseudomonas julia]
MKLSENEIYELVRAKATLDLILGGHDVGPDEPVRADDSKRCYNCSSDCISSCQGSCSGECSKSCASTCSSGCDTVVSNK